MELTTRAATPSDLAACLWVEHGAMPKHRYLADVWTLFTENTQGELTIAMEDGKAVGIGKLTVLYDGLGWLETLRVHPDHQGHGVGKAIYRRYLEQVTELGLRGVGMYTGVSNVISRGLAERNGLSLRARYSGYARAVQAGTAAGDFAPLSPQMAETALAPYYSGMGGFLVLNRTFYPVRTGLGAALAQQGWVYGSPSGDVAVIGARFQRNKALHLAHFQGDIQRVLAFADSLACRAGAATLSAMRPYENDAARALFLANGFEQEPADCITLWRMEE